MSDSFGPHESQHTRPPCPSPTPGVHSNSCPSSRWCHQAISSSVVPFSSCPQSLPASGSFPVSQLFTWGSQSIGVSALVSVLPMNSQDWSPLGWTGWISLQSKGLSKVFSNTIVQKHQFFGAQLSSQSSSHMHTWSLEKPQPWLDYPTLVGIKWGNFKRGHANSSPKLILKVKTIIVLKIHKISVLQNQPLLQLEVAMNNFRPTGCKQKWHLQCLGHLLWQ